MTFVSDFALESLGQDVHYGIADDGPTSQGVELVDQNFETRLTETLLEADQYEGRDEADQ